MGKELKRIWDDLKRSPGLLIALIVVVGFVLYIFYKNNQNASNATNANNTGTGTGTIYLQKVYSPTPPASGSGTSTGTSTGGTLQSIIAVISGPLATTPGGTNNKGTNIATVPQGATLQIVSGPTTFGTNKYYQVNYNGQTGYVNSKTIGL